MSDSTQRLGVSDADLAWCHEAVGGVSRTFALTVDVLEEPMASYICVGYLVCRIADTIEDAESIPADEQARLLRLYDRTLDPDGGDVAAFADAAAEHRPEAGSPDWEVVASAPRVIRILGDFPPDVREAVVPPARELVRGMAMFVERYGDVGGLRIQSRGELEEYCHYAAGTVGTLVTNLVARGDIDGERRGRLYETAEGFGQLLQLVNIAKDVYADYTRENNVYLPAEWLADEGVPQEGVLSEEHASGATAVVRRTAAHARTFLDDAEAYLRAVPTTDGNTLAAWAIPYLLAVGTLRELRSRPEDALSSRGVKVSRQEVYALMEAMTGPAGRESLGRLRERTAEEPFHEATSVGD
ncbi:MAG: phytoene/squalene synthase family protein [Salinigranum sp.]